MTLTNKHQVEILRLAAEIIKSHAKESAKEGQEARTQMVKQVAADVETLAVQIEFDAK